MDLPIKHHTPLFDPVRTLIFQLPIAERLAIVEEVRKRDWKDEFHTLRKEIGKELSDSGIREKDIPALIEALRKKR